MKTPKASESAAGNIPDIVTSLKRLGTDRMKRGLGERYGIKGLSAEAAFGVPMAAVQKVAKGAKSKDRAANHALAQALWDHTGPGQYEARMVAIYLDAPELVTARQMDRWAAEFDNWAICDTACFALFDRVPADLAFAKVEKWADSKHEFVKRGSLALIAGLAQHTKTTSPELERRFAACLPVIEKCADDERNFVKKGASWALRGLANRSPALRTASVVLATRLAASPNAASRWIGKDVLRQVKAK